MADPQTVTVVVIDDHPVFRDRLAEAIEHADGLRLVGVASTAEAGAALLRNEHPDVALVDIHMPGADGLSLLERLPLGAPAPRLLMITGDPSGPLIADALGRGAAGFLTKGAPTEDVVEAVRDVAAGRGRLDDESQALLVARLNDQQVQPRGGLSGRELEVLRRTAEGHSTHGIATMLHVSPGTVKGDLASIYRRLGVRDRAAAVAVAFRRGLID